MNIKALPVLLAAAMIAASAAAQEIKKRTRSEIEACFNKSLNGEAANFDNNRRIKAKNIEKSAKTVWECWRNAVNAFDKEQLPVATTNGARDTLYWQMPTHPEPDARMPFHYIYKGEKPDAGYPLFLYMHGSGPKKSEWETGFRLCSMFDITKPITVIVNGRLVWKGKATPTLKSMVESCALFFDPERVFPAAIDIEIE